MQRLQQIIQTAVQNQTGWVEVKEEAQGYRKDGSKLDWSIPVTSEEYMQILGTLFKTPSELSNGKIDIPGLGSLKTIGDPNHKSIHIFFPECHDQYENVWDEKFKNAFKPDLVPEPPAIPNTPEQPAPMPLASPSEEIFEGDLEPSSFDAMFAPIAETQAKNEPAPPPAPKKTPVKPQEPINADSIDMESMFLDSLPMASPIESTPTSKAPEDTKGGPDNIIPPINFSPDPEPELKPKRVAEPLETPPISTAQDIEISIPDIKQTMFDIPQPIAEVKKEIPVQSSGALDSILHSMLEKNASDVHFTSGEPLSFRIDGQIIREGSNVYDEAHIQSLFHPIMPQNNRDEFKKTNDTDFAYEISGVGRFRVNLFQERNGMGAVLRHIPSEILSFSQLGLPPIIKKFCELNKGLVVVTGPTGSGKSTTLAAMVDYINETRHEHILTLEDPVEFVHPQKKCLIRQREINTHTQSFTRALKAALREDPDIILVGELRDLETTAMAIEIAETGHLVLGTLHTTSAISTVDRIIDQYPSEQQDQIRTMLSESLRGVVSQTLLRKIGGGRVAAHEILVTDHAVSSLIREGKTHMIANHLQSQKAAGNMILNDQIANLVKEGLVEPKEAYLKSINKAELMNKLHQLGVSLNFESAS